MKLTRFLCILLMAVAGVSPAEPIKALIVDGQNNHDWARSTPYLQEVLKRPGHFEVTVYNTPAPNASAEAWQAWQPEFKKFGCVVMDYNGQMWPEEIRQRFVRYIQEGGGAVVIHAANNAFTGWKEYEQMVGLLWRDKTYGSSLYLDDSGQVLRVRASPARHA